MNNDSEDRYPILLVVGIDRSVGGVPTLHGRVVDIVTILWYLPRG